MRSLLSDRKDVALFEDLVLDPVDLDLLATVLAKDHYVANTDVDRDAVPIIVTTTFAHSHDLAKDVRRKMNLVFDELLNTYQLIP